MTLNPKNIFLIDSIGAFLTAFFLIGILARFEEFFGMPPTVLYTLSFIACVYAVYSFCCYFFLAGNWLPFLQVIAIANLVYCFLTISFVIYFYQKLTSLGLIYFLLELIVLCSLIVVERREISKIINNLSST